VIWYIILGILLIQSVIGILMSKGVIFSKDIGSVKWGIRIGGFPALIITTYPRIKEIVKYSFIFYPCRSKNSKERWNMYCSMYDILNNSIPSYIVVFPRRITIKDIINNKLINYKKI
jgi:hypothetical protein